MQLFAFDQLRDCFLREIALGTFIKPVKKISTKV